MKKVELNIPHIEILTKDYLELNSSYKVANKYGISATTVKRLLKEAGVLRTQNAAATIRNKTHSVFGRYERTDDVRKKLSESAAQKIGEKNPFFGKTHNEETKKKIGLKSKERTGKRNPNYKRGNYLRRPRDYKIHALTKLRKFVFNRDKFTCHYCQNVGGHLHAHHIIPYWVKPDAFLDESNLITVCTTCHFEKAHLKNWAKFDTSLVSDSLLIKYSLDRDRLSELAIYIDRSDSQDCTNKNKGAEENSK